MIITFIICERTKHGTRSPSNSDAPATIRRRTTQNFQEELRAFAAALRSAGLGHSRRGVTGYSQLQFLVSLPPEMGAILAGILTTWIQNQSGRSVRATLGDREFELQNAEDLARLVENINQIRGGAETPKGKGGS